MRVVAQNASPDRPLPADGRIELAFDRYLNPASITRQTFQTTFADPKIAYDPIARIVTITPAGPLATDLTYAVLIRSPSGPNDVDGLRAVDGATIDPLYAVIEFPVIAPAGGLPAPPPVDFCRDVLPIFASKCTTGPCHGSPPQGPTGATAAAGLSLDSPQSITATAVGRVAQGANTGPRASAQPAGAAFGVDMPIIDPGTGAGGNPANSWLIYKLLMAVPPAQSSTPGGSACNGAAAPDAGPLHLLAPPALTDPVHDPARSSLRDFVLGREMPFPSNPAQPLEQASAPLTLGELELITRWIAQDPRAGTASPGHPLLPARCCSP